MTRYAWLAAFAVAVVVFATAERKLLSGRAVPSGDSVWFFAPQYVHLSERARAGELYLWDPWTNAGLPTGAYTEVGTYSPLTILSALITGPTPRGFLLYWAAMWLLGGLGMLLLTRHLGAPPWGGFVVTLGFLFCGFFAEHAQHCSWLYSFAALPWVVWRLDAALLDRRTLPAIESGAIWGLSMLAGYPGVLMATGMAAGLWAAGRVLCSPSRRGAAALHCIWLMAIWGAAGLVVMSPTLVTFLKETRGYSDRSHGLPRELALCFNYLHPRGLLSLATPYSPVWQALALPWTTFDASRHTSLYVGFGASWLALAALLLRPRQAWRWWLVAMALVGIGLAAGPLLPFRGWLYDYCPPSRFFMHSVIFQLLAIFAAFVLAALASADVAAHANAAPPQPAPHGRLAHAAVLVGLAGLVGCWAATTTPGRSEIMPWRSIWPSCLGWGAIMLLGAIALVARRRPRLQNALLAAICVLAVVDAYQTSSKVMPLVGHPNPDFVAQWNRQFHERRSGFDIQGLSGLDRKFDYPTPLSSISGVLHLSSRTPVLQAGPLMALQFHQAWVAAPALRDAAMGPQRIWFAPAAVELPWRMDVFAGFSARSSALGAPPLVVHRPEEMALQRPVEAAELDALNRAVAEAPAARRIDVELLEYRPNSMAFRVNCPSDGWLTVTDRWAPGWSALVDGQPTRVYGGMFIFRALKVHAGANEIRFQYRPWGHPWLLMASYGVLAFVLAAAVVRCVRPRGGVSCTPLAP